MEQHGEVVEHVRGLVARLMAGLDELGAKVATQPFGPLVCIRSTDAPAFVAALAADGIVASERASSVRISLHLYNNEDDVDAVLAALARNRRLTHPSSVRNTDGVWQKPK